MNENVVHSDDESADVKRLVKKRIRIWLVFLFLSALGMTAFRFAAQRKNRLRQVNSAENNYVPVKLTDGK